MVGITFSLYYIEGIGKQCDAGRNFQPKRDKLSLLHPKKEVK